MSVPRLACTILLTVVLLGSLAACGSGSPAPESSDTSTTSTEKSTVRPSPDSTSGSASVWPGRLAVGGVALVLGVLLGLGLRPRLMRSETGSDPLETTSRSAPVPPSASPPHAPPVSPPAPSAQAPDPALVDGLITLADLADSPAVQVQVRATLQRVGVVEMAATPGERFDPDRHHAVAAVATADPGRHMSIARVIRGGWATSTAVIRPADVEVSRHPDGSG